jgi:hypothetical protein
VQSAFAMTEPDGCGSGLAKRRLHGGAIRPREDFRARAARRFRDRLHQRDQLLPQIGQDRGDVGCFRIGFVIVQERVVRIRCKTKRRSSLPFKIENRLQMGRERGEVVRLPRRHPRLLAQHFGPGGLFHQLRGQLHALVVIAAELADRRAVIAVGIGREVALGQRRQQFAQPRVRS